MQLNTDNKIFAIQENQRLQEAANNAAVIKPAGLVINSYEKAKDPPSGFTIPDHIRSAPITVVYDRNKLCIGVIENGVFKFIDYYREVCTAPFITGRLEHAKH